ncbi:MAG: hypothetical protein V4757_07000 [Pseudomonadota bacterium]
MTDQDRQEFEAKFSRPPYEFGMERFGDNSAWPGNYRDYHTQCAWEGYRAARTPSQAPAPGDAGVVEALRPMTDAQVDELLGEANRGFCIERDDYLKAVRDTEAFHRAALSAGDAAPQPAEPMFWVRLFGDGMYEGPMHHKSAEGRMRRDEKPEEWHPLYLGAAPTPQPSTEESSAVAPQAARGWVMVPVEPTQEMWSELARDIVWWLYTCQAPHHASKMYKFLRNLGREIPEWLLQEIPDVDHTPAKGDFAVAIYRAMISAAPTPPQPAAQPDVAALIEELDNAAGRLTQYTNNPLDGLLNAAARKLEELSAAQPGEEAHPDTVRLDFVINEHTSWYSGRGPHGAGILCYGDHRAETHGQNMREAIDAARAAQPATQKEMP